MQDLQVFNFQGDNEVRTVVQDGEPLFVAKDVCEILGVKNVSDTLSRLDDDEKGVVLIDTLGGRQSVAAINESGLYALVLSSRKPEAKPFRKWVTSEVLPSIRKSGSYALQRAPQTYIEALEAYVASEKARIAAEEQAALEQQRASELSDEVDQLSEVVDELFGYSSLLRIAKHNGVSENLFSWRKLKGAAIARGLDIKSVPCPRFVTKNLYPHEAWVDCYPDMELPDRASTTLVSPN